MKLARVTRQEIPPEQDFVKESLLGKELERVDATIEHEARVAAEAGLEPPQESQRGEQLNQEVGSTFGGQSSHIDLDLVHKAETGQLENEAPTLDRIKGLKVAFWVAALFEVVLFLIMALFGVGNFFSAVIAAGLLILLASGGGRFAAEVAASVGRTA